MRDVPGEVFIDSNETAGLPGRDVEQYAKHQAEKVVRAHKYNFLKFSGKSHRSQDTKSKKSRRGFFSARNANGDVEKSAEARTEPAMPRNTGILSTLLTAYEPASALQSGTTTARSSFDASRPTSPYIGPASASSSAAMMPPPPPPRSSEAAHGALNSSSSSLRPPNHPWTKTFGMGDGRPSKARSGAGVFGPLIASAGNISGVAAPHAATIAPNLKRPGYHLSR